jgi:hypothetical protein
MVLINFRFRAGNWYIQRTGKKGEGNGSPVRLKD